jgi:4-aminobutyrate aminotransferase-like enzyme
MLVQASQQYCWDEKGRKYIDAYSNVCHVGHTHPHVVQAVTKAMSTIVSNTRYLHPTIVAYADKLKSKLPPKLSVCFFVNSGSEANDLAIRLARIYTGRKPVACLEYAYHGTTAVCTGISNALSTGSTAEPKDYQYCKRDIYSTPLPDPYRGKYKGSDPRAGEKYAKELEKTCSKMPEGPAAFIHECAQGVGGQIVYPPDFLQHAYRYIRSQGGVCIADEVQTGFGRTGTHFWAFEAQGVVPDIVVMGKPIGNGFPLGAVVCTREIAKEFDDCQYFNTAGGNPVSCAAGLAVLEVIEDEGLQEHTLQTSIEFMRGLQALKKAHPIIGDVRGIGMYVGVELVRDRRTLEPAKEETAYVMERMKHFGVLVGKGGYMGNVIRMKPPLCFNVQDAIAVCEAFDKVFTEMERNAGPITSAPNSARQASTYVFAQGNDSDTEGPHTSRTNGRAVTKRRNDDEASVADSVDVGYNSVRRRLEGNGSVLDRVPRGVASVVEKSLNGSKYACPY